MNAEVSDGRGCDSGARGGEGGKKITVLIADDEKIVRTGIRRLLKWEADMEVVAEAENGRVAIRMAEEFRPNVVLMDITMPLLNGMEATRQILKLLPATRVLVLTSCCEDRYILESFEAGVAGYLVKPSDVAELLHAIREVHGGHGWCNAAIAERYRELCKHRLPNRKNQRGG